MESIDCVTQLMTRRLKPHQMTAPERNTVAGSPLIARHSDTRLSSNKIHEQRLFIYFVLLSLLYGKEKKNWKAKKKKKKDFREDHHRVCPELEHEAVVLSMQIVSPSQSSTRT